METEHENKNDISRQSTSIPTDKNITKETTFNVSYKIKHAYFGIVYINLDVPPI